MLDRVTFRATLGVVGRLVERVLLERYLRHLIETRNAYLKTELSTTAKPTVSVIRGFALRRIRQDQVVTVPTSRADRHRQRRPTVEPLFGENAEAALDILELIEFLWHDCYGEVTPPGRPRSRRSARRRGLPRSSTLGGDLRAW
jgi:hypothetical protein